MHHPKILEKFGCTPLRLREIFTNRDASTPDGKICRKVEDRIRARVQEGVRQCAKNYTLYQAVDLAWDSPPIQKEVIPLLLWAQGKIKKETVLERLAGTPMGQDIIHKQKDKTIKVDFPRFFEISITLVRSYVNRRLATQTARFANLWPFFRYEPRGTDPVSKFKADVLSQRIDIMSDAYNYRHFGTQCDRDMLLYSHSVAFPRSAWDKVTQWRPKNLNTGNIEDLTAEEIEIESYVAREGVDFVNPHPSRTFRDMSAPFANINTDTGPIWVGHWNIQRYGALLEQGYFNLNCITTNGVFGGIISQYPDFFGYYFDPCVLALPDLSSRNPTASNDREGNIGVYSENAKDNGVFTTEYFERINPKHEGYGDYDCDIWVRYAVAGDGTVLGAEFMPSTPAAYGGINENDSRAVNASLAMELLPYQDQMTNLCSQMILVLRTSLVQLWLIDKDSITKETLKYFEDGAAQKEFFIEPKILAYSSANLREMGITDPSMAFKVITAQVGTKVSEIFSAMVNVLNLADRILSTSANELGQAAPREISAREVQEISTTTSTVSSSASDGIDEQRAALKKILYQSTVCCASANMRVPVLSRYTKDTLIAAGFTLVDADKLDKMQGNEIIPIATPVLGNVTSLIYDYLFDSRDGAERTLNSQSAQVINQMIQNIAANPELARAVGKRRFFALFNEVVRLSGAGTDLKIELDENEDDAFGEGALDERMSQVEAALKELMARLGAPAGAPAPGAPAVDGAAIVQEPV